MLWEHPQATVSTTVLESFIYLFSRRVLDDDESNIETPNINISAPAATDKQNSTNPAESVKWKKSWTTVVRDIARDSWRHRESAARGTVGFYVVPQEYSFLRCKSISAYFEANRLILKQSPYTPPPSTATANGAVIGRDSLISIGTEMGEKTNVKRSIVGADCKFGRECRISGCVIMDGVTIGNNVHLDNCVIANGVIIEDKARLSGCTIEGRYIVSNGSKSFSHIIMFHRSHTDTFFTQLNLKTRYSAAIVLKAFSTATKMQSKTMKTTTKMILTMTTILTRVTLNKVKAKELSTTKTISLIAVKQFIVLVYCYKRLKYVLR